MNDEVAIQGIIVANNGVTLFLSDGNTEILSSADYKIPNLVENYALHKKNGTKFYYRSVSNFHILKDALKKEGLEVESPDKLFKSESVNSASRANGLNDRMIAELVSSNNVKGVANFMKRVDKVAENRKHSMIDLIQFMSRNKLPIAADGTIICYKILHVNGNTWYDPHSKTVPQNLGTRVEMPESLVDDDRRLECSTGLHVCSRGYLKGFYRFGNVITLVKVAPEDVIAVPHNESTKMRAKAYDIVALVPAKYYDALVLFPNNTLDSDFDHLVFDVITGRHAAIESITTVSGDGRPENKKIEVNSTSPIKPEVVNGVKVINAESVTAEPKPITPLEMNEIISKIGENNDMSTALNNNNLVRTNKVKADVSTTKASKTKPTKAKVGLIERQVAEFNRKYTQAKREWMKKNNGGHTITSLAAKYSMDRGTLSRRLTADGLR